MKRISEVLVEAIEGKEVLRAARAQVVMKRWGEAVGATLASNSTPDNYDHGVLWIAASGSAWAHELRLRQETILSRLNEMADEPGLFEQLRIGSRKPRA